ncbi:MAG TPA: hypothetical protein DDZ80_10850 [Cyanobacteria bacterium UBA8803]|nr:hypothetical protein [Cyanobacteria bacterium UBA9273]HBL58990.1 hypothetical protein [Cyanobacteria bacterium UBA8803]
MKLRSFFYVLAAGASVLLLIAVGGFFWLTSQSPLNLLQAKTLATPTAAIFVPKQTPAMVSLLVNPDRLVGFRQLLASPGNRHRTHAELKQLEESLLAPFELDYQRDIKPWAGDEITLAVTSLDFDRDRKNATQPGYLLAFTTKDAARARESLQLFYSRQAIAGTEDLVFEKYKGVNLIYRRPRPGVEVATDEVEPNPPTEFLTSAIVGDRFVLFANHPKVLRDAINNVQVADLNLASDPEYQRMLQGLTAPRIGVSFVNLPSLAAWISDRPIPVRDSFEGSQTIAIALSLDRQGLLAQTAVLGSESSAENAAPVLAQPVDALQYLPAKSTFAIAGTDLNQWWHQFSTGLASDNTLKSLLDQSLAQWESRWGIKLPEDVFSWVQGEYALSLIPRTHQVNPDWIFVAQKTDTAQANASIKHLDEIAKQQGLSVGKIPLGDRQITAWTELMTSKDAAKKKDRLMNLEAQVQGVHGTVGNYEIFTTSIATMNKAIKGLDNSLLNREDFQSAIAPLSLNNNGYFYLDWPRGKTFIERQVPLIQVLELVGQPLFEHLQAISASSYGSNQGVQQSQLFFQLVEPKKG